MSYCKVIRSDHAKTLENQINEIYDRQPGKYRLLGPVQVSITSASVDTDPTYEFAATLVTEWK